MIDDDILASHVRAALDGIEVPADGAARVLAARDLLLGIREPSEEPVPPGATKLPGGATEVPGGAAEVPGGAAWVPGRRTRLPTGSRWLLGSAAAVVALVAVAVVALAGVRGGTSASKTSSLFARSPATSGGAHGALAPAAGPDAGLAAGRIPGLSSQAAPNVTQAPSSPAPTPAGATPDRVVQTGSLILTVASGHLDATVAALGNRTSGAGGQVAKSQTVDSPAGPSADLTLKVPAGNFTTLLSAVRSLGAATSVNTSAVDVTATYVDLTARLNALEATRAQFLQILAKAQSIGDILAVEAQITPVQTQIEQLQGQQQVLDDQTSFATLAIHVAVPAARAPVARPAGGLGGAWAHARHAFASGIESVVSSLGGIAVFLVCVAVLVGLARVTWAVIRRRLV